MHENIERVLIDEKSLKERIAQLRPKLARTTKARNWWSSVCSRAPPISLTELTQHITVPVRIDFIKASSYGSGTTTTGKVDIQYDTSRNLAGKNILLVDDVIDTGLTLKAVGELLRNRNPKTLKVAAMLDKKERRLVKVLPDYAGFEIPDEFVVGFGLDYDEEYRNLPFIGILKRSVYEK